MSVGDPISVWELTIIVWGLAMLFGLVLFAIEALLKLLSRWFWFDW